MSLIDSQTVLSVLSPPEFGGECAICGSWRKLLPWQVTEHGTWGNVCAECGKSVLVQQLRSRLPGSFTKVALFKAILRFGVNRLEAELLITDFEKEGLIAPAERRHADWKGFCHAALSPLAPGNEAAPSQFRHTPRDTAPGKPSISMMPSTGICHTQSASPLEPLCTQPKHRRRTWRRLSQAEIFERCERLSKELLGVHHR